MEFYGDKKRGNKSFKIQDLTIACKNLDELDRLIYFLSYARVSLSGEKYCDHDDIIKIGEDKIVCHRHYCFWDKKNWKKEDSDIIVITSFKADIKENGEVEWVDIEND